MLVDAECKINFLLVMSDKEIGKKAKNLSHLWLNSFVRLLTVSKSTERKYCRKVAVTHFTSCISVHTKEGFSSIPLTVHVNVKLLQAEEIFQHYLNI